MYWATMRPPSKSPRISRPNLPRCCRVSPNRPGGGWERFFLAGARRARDCRSHRRDARRDRVWSIWTPAGGCYLTHYHISASEPVDISPYAGKSLSQAATRTRKTAVVVPEVTLDVASGALTAIMAQAKIV